MCFLSFTNKSSQINNVPGIFAAVSYCFPDSWRVRMKHPAWDNHRRAVWGRRQTCQIPLSQRTRQRVERVLEAEPGRETGSDGCRYLRAWQIMKGLEGPQRASSELVKGGHSRRAKLKKK